MLCLTWIALRSLVSNFLLCKKIITLCFVLQAKAVEAGEKIDYSLSDPDLPDTLIDTARILKEIDLQERKDNARSPAFINSELETVKPNVAHNDFARVMRSFILANTHHGEDNESQGMQRFSSAP